MNFIVRRALVTVILFLTGAVNMAWSQTPHYGPPFNIDSNRIAVAGISSGGAMATQLQLAYPKIFARAAILAGIPYGCARLGGSGSAGLGNCLYPSTLSDEDLDKEVNRAIKQSRHYFLGNIQDIAKGNVFVLYGTADQVVGTQIAGSVTRFYEKLKAKFPGALPKMQIVEDSTRKFGHTFPTDRPPLYLDIQYPPSYDDCTHSNSPYLGHCNFDAAKDILDHIYSDYSPVETKPTSNGKILTLSSRDYGANDTTFAGDSFYVYEPDVCATGQACGMLVALHGCNQNDSAIGQLFVQDAGFNRWADDYHLIVVYPQTKTVPQNYGGCWDWWGYTGTHFDQREAPQMRWLANLVRKLDINNPASRSLSSER